MQALFTRAACAGLAAAAVFASAAGAETVRVVNDKGRGQAQVQAQAGAQGPLTDATAEASLTAAAGTTLSGQISRVLHPICPPSNPPPPAPSYPFSFQATGGTTTLTIP